MECVKKFTNFLLTNWSGYADDRVGGRGVPGPSVKNRTGVCGAWKIISTKLKFKPTKSKIEI